MSKSDLGSHFGKVLYFSVLLLSLYIPFNATQNMMASIQNDNGFGNLGFKLVGVVYLFQCIASCVSAAVANAIGIKKAFIIGSFCLSILIVSNILSAWRAGNTPYDREHNHSSWFKFFDSSTTVLVTLYASSVISGSGNALIWCC